MIAGEDLWLEGRPPAVHCQGKWYSNDAADIAAGVAALTPRNASVDSCV